MSTEVGRFLLGVVRRDLTIAARRRGDWLTALFFFVMVSSLFPLAVGPDPALLQRIGPGVLWVAATLASLLSLSRLFEDDHRDGSLEQMLLAPAPVLLLVLGKVLAHWLVYAVPLLLATPLLGLQFNLPGPAIGVLVLSLVIGTPVLSLLGAAGAALTLGLRGGGLLLTLLVLPLYTPALIFGAGAVGGTLSGTGAEAHLSLLGAFFLVSFAVAPWIAAASLKVSVE